MEKDEKESIEKRVKMEQTQEYILEKINEIKEKQKDQDDILILQGKQTESIINRLDNQVLTFKKIGTWIGALAGGLAAVQVLYKMIKWN